MTKAKTDNIPVWLPMEKVYDIDLSRFGGVAQPALAMVRKRFRLGEYRYIDANGRQHGADLDADFWLLADIDPKTGSAICPRYIVGAAGPVRHIPARQAYKLELKAPRGQPRCRTPKQRNGGSGSRNTRRSPNIKNSAATRAPS
jgi:hypothetical protein